ncbi:serine hydrolase [Rhizorhabdus sp. FW153]|uniref:serine hydrolase n=1 Tax=Rhizorhabdus sp. FW153 TaxID=3400216 RepID=UPI003CECD5D1
MNGTAEWPFLSRLGGACLAALPLMLASCSSAADEDKGRNASQLPRPILAERSAATRAAGPVFVSLTPIPPSAASRLDRTIARLGRSFAGDVGIAVRDVQTGWTSDHRGLDPFPQQSVSKLWVALTAFDQVDRGTLSLDREVSLTRADLTLFHQPVRALALRPGGYRTYARDLVVRALTQSDNSANDRMLREVGGPGSIRATLAAKAIAGIRFGPGERALQAKVAGLDWKADYAVGNRFYEARDALPRPARRAAFDAYTADPMDGASPLGIVDALARLKQGRLLSQRSTDEMLDIMSHTRTGANRLKGGLKPGWTLAHKTGTGQILEGEQAGYNDVGILTSPEGRSYAVAVMIGRTDRPLVQRMALMQKVVTATIDYDRDLARQREEAPPTPATPLPTDGPD